MSQQLTFDLPSKPALGREAFFVSDANQLAVARLDEPNRWPNGKIILTGPQGSGKTHLAHVWARAQNARFANQSDDLPADGENIVVDDADQWTSPQAEAALFHLHNHVLAGGGTLLLTSRKPPALWSTSLPDLESRMLATDTIAINEPDDALLAAMLVKLFDDRQIAISPPLVAYIVPRMTRSAAAVHTLVEALDQAALSEGKAITRSLAARLLDKPDQDGIE